MDVLIIGAGVIGSIYGWALSQAGHSVMHLVRSGRSDQYKNGIAIDLMDRRKGHQRWFKGTYEIRVTEGIHPNANDEIIIIPVRHYAIEDALRELVPLVPNADCILLTQNWKGTEGIDHFLSMDKCVFGDAKAGGSFQGHQLVGTIYGIDIGIIGKAETESLRRAKELFLSADLRTIVQKNILHYLWVQYAVNGGGWPAVVQAGSLRSALKSPQLVQSLWAAVRECLDVIQARGVDISQFPETGMYLTDLAVKKFFYITVMKLLIGHSKYIQRNSAHALADPKEIKTFYYDLIGAGERLGIKMPVMLSFKSMIDRLGTPAA
jgi:2-dehydropantoate 2-reductase